MRRQQRKQFGKGESKGALSTCETGDVCETSKCKCQTGQTSWQRSINTEDHSTGERERETTQGREQRAGAWAQEVSIICLINKDRTRLTCPFQGKKHTREQQCWVKVSTAVQGLQRSIRDRTGMEGCSMAPPEPFRFLSGATLWQNNSRCSLTALVHTYFSSLQSIVQLQS